MIRPRPPHQRTIRASTTGNRADPTALPPVSEKPVQRFPTRSSSSSSSSSPSRGTRPPSHGTVPPLARNFRRLPVALGNREPSQQQWALLRRTDTSGQRPSQAQSDPMPPTGQADASTSFSLSLRPSTVQKVGSSPMKSSISPRLSSSSSSSSSSAEKERKPREDRMNQGKPSRCCPSCRSMGKRSCSHVSMPASSSARSSRATKNKGMMTR